MSQTRAIQDRLLENVSNGYFPEGFLSKLLLPEVKVKEKTGKIGLYGSNHLRVEHALAGGRGAYRRVEPIVRSTTSYDVKSYGLEGMVTEDDYRNVQLPFKAEEDEVLGLKMLIAINAEAALSSALTNASVITQNTTLVAGQQYNPANYSTSDPLGDAYTARQTVYAARGVVVNTATMQWPVMNALAYHPQILSALGYTQNRAGQLSEAELAKALGVERLLVSKAKYVSSKEGQTDTFADLWNDSILYSYLPSKAAKYQKSLGYRMVLDGQGEDRVFKYSIDNPPNATGILVDTSYEFLITDAACGYLVIDTLP